MLGLISRNLRMKYALYGGQYHVWFSNPINGGVIHALAPKRLAPKRWRPSVLLSYTACKMPISLVYLLMVQKP